MSKRIEYIDALRGLAITLVVMGHVWSFGIYGNTTDLLKTNSICNFTNMFHVALFFVISGFVFYKHDAIWDLKSILKFTIKKLRLLIIPAIIFIIIYNAVFTNYNLLDIIRTNYKIGFWFTISLFMFFTLHIITIFITGNKKRMSLAVSFLLSFILYLCIYTGRFEQYYQTSCFKMFSIQQIGFYLFFQCGIILKYNYCSFTKIIQKDWFKFFIIVFLFVTLYLYFFVKPTSFVFNITKNIMFILPLLITLSAITVCFIIFYNSSKKNNYIWHTLQYIGKKTLDIYFIHYFFLPEKLPSIYSNIIHNNCILELYISIPITIGLIIACVCVSKFIRMSRILTSIVFGSPQ